MHLAGLALTDFRSYAGVDLALDVGVTVFVGPNGQGKTNLVEAVGYLATLASHRVATDAPLVRAGASRAVVQGAVERDGRRALLEIEITPGRANRARVNRAPTRPRDLLGVLRTVLFAPEDLALVKGDPADRRRYLDDLLVARAPRFAGVRADYDRVLKQRTALLRSAAVAGRARSTDLPTLDVWDAHLARTGAELVAARLELVAALEPLMTAAYDSISDGVSVPSVRYRSSFEGQDGNAAPVTDREQLATRLLAALAQVRRAELERGVTLVGPHRDDLVLALGPLPAKGYASHGESWSLALALRLAAYDLLRADGGDPVLVLDDVFAELDAARRRALAKAVAGAEQVLVTAAVPDDVPEEIAGTRFDVAGGEVRRAG